MAERAARYVKWEPMEGIAQPCAAIKVEADEGYFGLTLVLEFYEPHADAQVGSAQKKLRVVFTQDIVAYSVYEEFAHPLMDEVGNVPRFKSGAAFPCLEVRDSPWVASFSPLRRMVFGNEACRHFCFIGLNATVDVLTTRPVQAEWV